MTTGHQQQRPANSSTGTDSARLSLISVGLPAARQLSGGLLLHAISRGTLHFGPTVPPVQVVSCSSRWYQRRLRDASGR